MGDSLKKVQAGQRLEIPAEAYNAFVDAVRDDRARRHSIEQEAGVEIRQTGIVKIRNQTGVAQDRYHVLALHDPIVQPADNLAEFKNRVSFAGHTPAEPRRSERFAILLEPLPLNGIGRGILAGVSPVRLEVVRESDQYAELIAGATDKLRTTPTGLTRILWKESGLGLKWGVVRLSERPRFAIFQLSGTWEAATTPEADGWMKMTGCKPVFYFSSTKTYTVDNSEPVETVWHAVGYSPSERAAVIALHKSAGVVPSKFGGGDWVWCHWSEDESRWQVLAAYEDHWRFKLLSPLARCGSASAQLVLYQTDKWCPVSLFFTVYDAVGVVCPKFCQESSGTSGCNCGSAESVPAGTFGIAKRYADSNKWEVLNLGEGCCTASGSSGSSSSGSSYSSSSGSSSASSSGSSSASSSSGSSSGSSSSGQSSSGPSSSGQGCVNIYETDIRCEAGKLNVYTRAITLCLSGTGLTRYEGLWVFSHQAGCCCCSGGSSSGSSSYSSSASGSSSSSAVSGSSSGGSGSSGTSGSSSGNSGSGSGSLGQSSNLMGL